MVFDYHKIQLCIVQQMHYFLNEVTDNCECSTKVYLQRGQIYEYVPVQSAWSHESIVQDICSVGGSEDDDMVCRSHSCKRKIRFHYYASDKIKML